MRIDAVPAVGLRPLSVRPGTLAGVCVAAALLTSTIVFSEPAIADAAMLFAITAVPVLGAARFGKAAILNFSLWLALVALGIAGTMLSTTFDTAIKHQLVTLFLACGAFVLAGYVAADPEPRLRMILWCYTIACLVATMAAFVGYFRIAPSTYDLFTNYDRARGTFKDPNVYGAALVPALVFSVWILLRERARRALVGAAVALPLGLGLLISFSRGAWVSTAVALLVLVALTVLKSRRSNDFVRFGSVGVIGVVTLLSAAAVATQMDQVRTLLEQRANLDQSYDQGPDGRFGGQQKARRLILDHPAGIGTHTFRDTYHHEEPHNVYLSMFLNAGWLGGLLYILSVVFTLSIGLRSALQTSVIQGPAIVAVAAFAGVAFEGFVIDSDHWRHFFIMMALVWGIADAGRPFVDATRRRDDPAD